MSRYFFYAEVQKWVKQCSCCGSVTEGTFDEAESFAIFQTMFAPSGSSSGAADNLQSRCWICNASKRRQIGASREIIEHLYKEQEGKCAICITNISILRNAAQPANVDHDERTGAIRGLLCGNCNRGIGMFFHAPAKLRAAATYCERHGEVVQLRCISDAG